jgi:acyl carrier protein
LGLEGVIKPGVSASPAQNRETTDLGAAVRDIVKDVSPSAVAKVRPDMELVAELGYDSVDLLELLVTLEDTLGLPSITPEVSAELRQVADVERIACEAMSRTSREEPD